MESRDVRAAAPRAFGGAAAGGALALFGSFVLLDGTGHGRYDVEWFAAGWLLLAVALAVVALITRSARVTLATALGLAVAVLATWAAVIGYVMRGGA